MSDVASEMLAAGMPAVEVMSEYVRACRRLGHATPDPVGLHTAYTAEDGADLQTLDADERVLSAAVAAAEEAAQLQEHAQRVLTAAWRGAGGEAAADHLHRHADATGAALDGLRRAAAALNELRNRLRELIDAKVEGTLAVEARGMRTEWLSAARIVTTGAGDQAGASEVVDLQVAPFVAEAVAGDWVSSMRDTEADIRQAYRDAVARAGAATAVFDQPGSFAMPTPGPAVAEHVSRPADTAAVTVPAGYAAVPAGPAVAPVPPVAPSPMAAPAAAPTVAPSAMDPMTAAPAGLSGLGGGAAPLGAGMSGLSGLGQSVSDILGGLLGAGGEGAGGGLDDLDAGLDDELDTLADDDPEDSDSEDADPEDDDPEDDDDEADEGDPEDVTEPVAEPEELVPDVPEPVAPQPEPPAPTPVPEPVADPVAAPVEVDPAETPCAIAADELPQAGP